MWFYVVALAIVVPWQVALFLVLFWCRSKYDKYEALAIKLIEKDKLKFEISDGADANACRCADTKEYTSTNACPNTSTNACPNTSTNTNANQRVKINTARYELFENLIGNRQLVSFIGFLDKNIPTGVDMIFDIIGKK